MRPPGLLFCSFPRPRWCHRRSGGRPAAIPLGDIPKTCCSVGWKSFGEHSPPVGRPIRQQPAFVGVGWTHRGLRPGPRPGQAQFISHPGQQRIETREPQLPANLQINREGPREALPHPFLPQRGQPPDVPAEPGQLGSQTGRVTGDRQRLPRQCPGEFHRLVGQSQAPSTVPVGTTRGVPSSDSSAEPTTFTPGSKVQSPLTRRLSAPRSDGACGMRASKS